MALADFLRGYGKAIIRLSLLSGDFSLVRREPSEEELGETNRSILFGGTGAFWLTHGAGIDAADGPPGLTAPVSWHAGRELAYVRMRLKSFDAADWRNLLRNRMTTDALALRRVRLRWLAGQFLAEEFDG